MARAGVDTETEEQHSIARSVTLHLLPGVVIVVFYALIAPLVRSLGFPSLMAIFLTILLVLVPFELGFLLNQSRRKNGDFSLRNVVLYRKSTPAIQVVALVIPLFIWSGIFAVILYPPLNAFFIGNFFSWVPDWFFFAEDFSKYSSGALLVTWVLGLILNAFVGPVTEDLYVRGICCRAYHVITTWQNVGSILGLLPMVYAVLFGINTVNEGKIVMFGGGIPLMRDDYVVGAVGVSGGTVDQDMEVAEAGVAAF